MDVDPLHEQDNLFRKIATGDEEAFRQIFHVYNAKLYPFVLNITRSGSVAEDIIQETFLRLWLHRSEVGLMLHPASWLYKVASNLSLTHLRSRAAEIRRLQRLEVSDRTGSGYAIENLSVKEIQLLLTEAVDRLPPRRQYIYRLSREQGLSHKEIAKKLRISPNTVKNQLVIAFRFIRHYLYQTSGITVSLLILLFCR